MHLYYSSLINLQLVILYFILKRDKHARSVTMALIQQQRQGFLGNKSRKIHINFKSKDCEIKKINWPLKFLDLNRLCCGIQQQGQFTQRYQSCLMTPDYEITMINDLINQMVFQASNAFTSIERLSNHTRTLHNAQLRMKRENMKMSSLK